MNKRYNDKIKKPVKPHRIVLKEEIPTKEEIQHRIERLEKLKKLGITVNTLDTSISEEYEEDLDKLEASILIMQDKEVPKELEQRILEKINKLRRVEKS